MTTKTKVGGTTGKVGKTPFLRRKKRVEQTAKNEEKGAVLPAGCLADNWRQGARGERGELVSPPLVAEGVKARGGTRGGSRRSLGEGEKKEKKEMGGKREREPRKASASHNKRPHRENKLGTGLHREGGSTEMPPVLLQVPCTISTSQCAGEGKKGGTREEGEGDRKGKKTCTCTTTFGVRRKKVNLAEGSREKSRLSGNDENQCEGEKTR